MKCLFIFLSLPIVLVCAEMNFISSNNLFATSLHKEISKNNSNSFLVSPFSAEIVLVLLQSGAKGNTARELQDCLHLPHNQELIKSSIKTTLSTLPNHDEFYSLDIANKIYVLKNFHIKEEFSKIASEVFYSEIENIDFSDSVNATNVMNKWVEQHTKNKIHDLINSESIDNDTRLVLINALYFQAAWKDPFDDYKTENRSFYLNNSNVIMIPTLKREEFYNYFENSELKAKFLEIPFNTENASMIFVLPNEKEGLSLLESNLEKVFSSQNFSSNLVEVLLPKFKIESVLNLKNILTKLGVSQVFNNADLSGIADENLLVSEAIQKTFISVKEEGVEAAAATYIEISLREGDDDDYRFNPKTFHADHPFLFYIKIKDLIIFSGRIISPITNQQ